MTDSSKTTVWRAHYQAFGTAAVLNDPDGNGTAITFNLRYAGQYADAESGLYYNHNRYYSPGTGRYAEADPLGQTAGTNLYPYTDSNPVNQIDPEGLVGPLVAAVVGYARCYVECKAIDAAIQAIMGPQCESQAAENESSCGTSCLNPLEWVKLDKLKALGKAAKDVAKRPSSFRKKTVQDAWDKAASGSKSGTKSCPTCGKDVEVAPGQGSRDWDVDHQPAWSERDLPSTREEVLDNYNTGTRLECPGCNRSRGAGPLE